MDPLNLRTVWNDTGRYGIPMLEPSNFEPTTLAAWHDPAGRLTAVDTGALHFFLDDYRFERTWTAPEAAMQRVIEVGAALTPDFSLWRDMPLVAQMWQIYRSRWVGALWQHNGLHVIPTVSWGEAESFDFAFEGLPTNGTVAISTVGIRDPTAKDLFRAGLGELLDRCAPRLLLTYGHIPDHCADLNLPRVHEYRTWWDARRKPKERPWADEDRASPVAETSPCTTTPTDPPLTRSSPTVSNPPTSRAPRIGTRPLKASSGSSPADPA